MEPKFDKRFIDEAVQEVLNEITREEAINQLKDFIILHREQHGWDVSTLNALDMAVKVLEQTEPARKKGKWIYKLEDWNKWTCSECGFCKRTDVHVTLGYKYCPHCGAEMEEVSR